jgi:hypothetical protein
MLYDKELGHECLLQIFGHQKVRIKATSFNLSEAEEYKYDDLEIVVLDRPVYEALCKEVKQARAMKAWLATAHKETPDETV